MGYRTNEKLPLINEAPDNSGLYIELYSEVCKRLGYKLEIIRLPKKRILRMLQDGDIDFYPVFIFTLERSKYCYFMQTGLKDQNVGISLNTLQDIRSFKELDGLTYIQPLGNANYLENINYININIIESAESDIGKIILLLQKGRGDFTIYQNSVVQYYLKTNRDENIKIHKKLLPDIINLPLGFSLKSPHCDYIKNIDFKSNKRVTIDNFPYKLKPNSIAYKFNKILKDLQKEGFTDDLYKKYFE